jgi:hypoxanthine phosphoribosyltransferase
MHNLNSAPVRVGAETINLDYWKEPEGVEVSHDDLRFLYIPDAVEALMIAEMAKAVNAYQIENTDTGRQITKAVMITMGGLLPGVLLHDHLSYNPDTRIPRVEFGTLGVQFYEGPGKPLPSPRVIQELTIDVKGRVVGVVEDLVDLGGTAKFVSRYLSEHGARGTVLIAPFLKSKGIMDEMPVIYFGIVPKHTWIITPRERVETLIKRVPYWKRNGATVAECEANLLAIGYPDYLVREYLATAYNL